MNAKIVKNCLLNAGVDHLYHANSVVTALSYINAGGLLSRQAAENLGVQQTAQYSDDIDRHFGIYNDIFFDSVDIHSRAHRPNDYGAVMFVYSIDVLDLLTCFDICITKDNPIYWEYGITEREKYFNNAQEILLGFSKGDFNKHITIKDISVPLSFNYLEEIVIDNPGTMNYELLTEAKGALEAAAKNIGLKIPITVRNCSANCGCHKKYTMSNQRYVYDRFKTEL